MGFDIYHTLLVLWHHYAPCDLGVSAIYPGGALQTVGRAPPKLRTPHKSRPEVAQVMFFSHDSNRNTAEDFERSAEGARGAPDEMKVLRDRIDAVDQEIVRLLDRRARMARRIGEVKQERGLEAYAPARERAEIGRAHVLTPVTPKSRIPSSFLKKKKIHFLYT